LGHSNFELVSDFGFRISDFGRPGSSSKQSQAKTRLSAMTTPDFHSLNASLERAILLGLAAEWAAAAEALPDGYRRLISPPLFAVRQMGRRLGRWHPDHDEIAVSRRLVVDHPWDAVRDVLLHEMAHQLAHRLPGGEIEPAHGPVFREACKLLNADPRASGVYPTLLERITAGSVHENDRLLLKIRKLLALAGSGNRHEAEAAMGKAHHLIRKYNVDLQCLCADRSFVSVFVGKPALRHFREHYHLARLLQEFYFVQGIWVSAWVVEKEKMGRVLEVSGTCANVQMAHYVYDFVNRFIEASWKKFNRTGSLNRYRKTDFAVGVVEGFREKLSGAVAKCADDQSTAIVARCDPHLSRYIRSRYPRLRSIQRNGGRQDPKVIDEGVRRGRKLVIARAVEDRGTDARPLLPPGTPSER
jgi:hypothetical protein